MPAIRVRIVRNQLDAETKARMWAIYRQYYQYSEASFMARIATNTHYAFYWAGDQLVGFTGLRLDRLQGQDRPRLLIYFGQTVVEAAYRGRSLLHATGTRLVWRCLPFLLRGGRLYWWCDALTYRSYLAFAKSLKTFFPSRHQATPPAIQELFDYLGQAHYAGTYCPQRGTVAKPARYVSDRSVALRPADLADPDIAFYAQANPLHGEGHGLLTLAPVTGANLLRLTQRLLRRAFKPTRHAHPAPAPLPARYSPAG